VKPRELRVALSTQRKSFINSEPKGICATVSNLRLDEERDTGIVRNRFLGKSNRGKRR
jgi:hypothetical protein